MPAKIRRHYLSDLINLPINNPLNSPLFYLLPYLFKLLPRFRQMRCPHHLVSDKWIGASTNQLTSNSPSTLQKAVYFGDVELVRTLLETGAYPHKPNDRGFSPIVNAQESDNQDIQKTLFDAKKIPRRGMSREAREKWNYAFQKIREIVSEMIKTGRNENLQKALDDAIKELPLRL